MRPPKSQSFSVTLYVILLFQLVWPTFSKSIDHTSSIAIPNNAFRQTRMLDVSGVNCTTQSCTEFGSLMYQSSVDYSIAVGKRSKLTINIQVGEPRREAIITFQSSIPTNLAMDIGLFPSDLRTNTLYDPPVGSTFWEKTVIFESSSTASRKVQIDIENMSNSQDANFSLKIAIKPKTESQGWIIAVIVVPIVGGFLSILYAWYYIRKIRRARRQTDYRRPNRERQVSQEPRELNVPEHQYQLAPEIQPFISDPEKCMLSEANFDNRFPEASFESFSSSFLQKACSICLEDLKEKQECRQLYCEHIFHSECAKLWLLNQMIKQKHAFCPNCNKSVTFPAEMKSDKIEKPMVDNISA